MAILLNYIENLIAELILNNRHDTAQYFNNNCEMIRLNSEQSDYAIEALTHIRAMAQYCNFSPIEEDLLDAVIIEAIKIKKVC